jgi:hypothetical protein
MKVNRNDENVGVEMEIEKSEHLDFVGSVT